MVYVKTTTDQVIRHGGLMLLCKWLVGLCDSWCCGQLWLSLHMILWDVGARVLARSWPDQAGNRALAGALGVAYGWTLKRGSAWLCLLMVRVRLMQSHNTTHHLTRSAWPWLDLFDTSWLGWTYGWRGFWLAAKCSVRNAYIDNLLCRFTRLLWWSNFST